MKAYTDEWVEDSVLMSFLSAAGCTCCAATHTNLIPYISQCSDLDTDTDGRDLIVKAHTIWPVDVSVDIWRERIRFRSLLKATAKQWTQVIPKNTNAEESVNSNSNNNTSEIENKPHSHTDSFIVYWNNLTANQRQHFFNFSVSYVHSTLKSIQISRHYFSLLRYLLTQLMEFPRSHMNLSEESGTPNEHQFASSLFHTGNKIAHLQQLKIKSETLVEICHCQEQKKEGSSEEIPECFVCLNYFQEGLSATERLRELLYEKKFVPKISDSKSATDDEPLHRKNVSLRSDRRMLRIFLFLLGMSNALKSFLEISSPSMISGARK